MASNLLKNNLVSSAKFQRSVNFIFIPDHDLTYNFPENRPSNEISEFSTTGST